jgi:hypothetical protein
MNSKISIQVGDTLFKAAGNEKFVLQARNAFEEKYVSLNKLKPHKPSDTDEIDQNIPNLDIDSYASILGIDESSKARELILATSCWLMIEKNMKKFSYTDLQAKISGASNYTQNKHGKNLKVSVRRLVKSGELIKKSSTEYYVKSTYLDEVKNKIDEQSV